MLQPDTQEPIPPLRYLATIGNTPAELYHDVAQNDAQWEEWAQILRLADMKPGPEAAPATPLAKLGFLATYPTLVLDTQHFDTQFKDQLLASFDDVDAATDGTLIHGDNLYALKHLAATHCGQVKCIYIDPPYNADAEESIYADRLDSESWLAMMAERLRLGWDLLSPDGIVFISIDSRERNSLGQLLPSVFPDGTPLPEITVKVKDAAGVGQQALIFDVLEYMMVYAKDLKQLQISCDRDHPAEFDEVTGPVKGYRFWIVDYGKPRLVTQLQRPAAGLVRVYACDDPDLRKAIDLSWPDEYVGQMDHVYADYNPSGGMIKQIRDQIPAKGLAFLEYVPSRGISAGKLTRVYFHNRRILARLSDIVTVRGGTPYRRSALTNLWEVPNATLHKEGGVTFRHGKKPLALIEKIVRNFAPNDDLVLDFFAGSGTTGHAVINLNREDGAARKFILVEMADYFDTVLVPRIKKAIFTPDWRGGKPKYKLTVEQIERTPRLVKILKLDRNTAGGTP